MKQAISYVLVTLVATCLLAAPASAQVASGLNELGAKGYVETGKYSDQDGNSGVFSFDGFYGRFLTSRLEVGPGFNFFKYADEPASGAMNAFADYHFGDTSRRLVPFAELSIGKFFSGADGDPSYVAVGPGVKWFFGEGGGALQAMAVFRRQFMDADLHGGQSGTNEVYLSVGVAVYFGR